jgi:CheY-like chemotaxis protein
MSSETTDPLAERIKSEFLDEARDIVNEIEVMLGNLRSGSGDPKTALSWMRRYFLNLRVGGRSVNLPAIDLIVHRLEDYVSDVEALSLKQIEDIQHFVDRLREALEAPSIDSGDLRQVVRDLPMRRTFEISDITFLDVEIMLVSADRTLARFVERELQACGYRVVNVAKSFEAIELAVRSTPDMIICSGLLDELTGIDLACAFASMPTTSKIPFAILTSFGWSHPLLDRLPPRAAIIRKGPMFGDDLAEALARFAIT